MGLISGLLECLPAQGSASAGSSLAQLTLDAAAALRGGMTLGDWRAENPDDSIGFPGTPDGPMFGMLCTRARATVPLAGGGTARRSTYFYQPATPRRVALPRGTPGDRLISECRAGETWITVDGRSAASADSLQLAAEQSISASIGIANRTLRLPSREARTWSAEAQWNAGGVRIVTSSDTVPVDDQDHPIPDVHRVATAVIGGWPGIAPRSNQSFEDDGYMPGQVYDQMSNVADRRLDARVQEAFGIAAVGGRAEHDLRSVLARFEGTPTYPPMAPPADVAAFMAALTRWFRLSDTLAPARRAAALFVADATVQRSECTGWTLPDSAYAPIRRGLNALGAEISWLDGEDPTFAYQGAWLKKALQVAPGTRAGDLALLMLAESGFGWPYLPGCGMLFRRVIARGNDYLRRYPTSTVRSDLHLLMGQAWGDIVALVNGADVDDAVSDEDLVKLRREEPSARAHAIAEYTLGFELAAASTRARNSWPQAWRLMAGLPPSRTFFYCIVD